MHLLKFRAEFFQAAMSVSFVQEVPLEAVPHEPFSVRFADASLFEEPVEGVPARVRRQDPQSQFLQLLFHITPKLRGALPAKKLKRILPVKERPDQGMNRHDPLLSGVRLDPAAKVPFLKVHRKVFSRISADSKPRVTHDQDHPDNRILLVVPQNIQLFIRKAS